MSGFSFPPPPPPPPKPIQPTSNQSGQGHQTSSEWRNDRGRGGNRGGQRGRGQRGSGAFNPNHQRGGYYSNSQTGAPQISSNTSTGSYGQDFSASYQSPKVYANPNSWTPQTATQAGQNAASPPRTAAGHKRKLDALKPHTDKDKRPGPPTAPAVPSFGAPILSPKSVPTTNQKTATVKPNARSLGLNPATNGAAIIYSDSEDDAFDEEAMYAELGNKLTFEHNGVVMSLKSQADLVAWKKERQKNWPTKARMVEKDEERRRIGEERRRLLNIATPVRPRQSPKAKLKQQARNENGEAQAASPDERASRLDELRKKVLDSEARNREAKTHEKQDEASAASPETTIATVDELQNVVGANVEEDATEDTILGADEDLGPEASEESSSDSSSESPSDSSSDSDSEDDTPEQVSSKPPGVQPSVDPRLPCRFFATRGHCKYGDMCRFKHETSAEIQKLQNQNRTQQEQRAPQQSIQPSRSDVQKPSGRKGIFQRLKEQEQEEEDRLALKVIKYLGKAGFFSEASVDGGE